MKSLLWQRSLKCIESKYYSLCSHRQHKIRFVLPSNAPHVASLRLYWFKHLCFFFAQIIRQIKMKIILLEISTLKAEIRCRLAGSVLLLNCFFSTFNGLQRWANFTRTSFHLISSACRIKCLLLATSLKNTLLLIQNILITPILLSSTIILLLMFFSLFQRRKVFSLKLI